MRSRLVWATSCCLLLAPVAAQDAEPTLVVPTAAAPVVDARVGADEWKGAVAFELRRGDDVFGRARMLRAGRELYLAYESEVPAWSQGLRFNFLDPVTQRRNGALVNPLHPQRPPLGLYRQAKDRPAQVVPAAPCDIRLELADAARFALELRVPLDLLEIGRDAKEIRFSLEVWHHEAQRPIAVYPHAARGIGAGLKMARLKPAKDWGAEAPVRTDPWPTQPALKVLEDIVEEVVGRAPGDTRATDRKIFMTYTGWRDGHRADKPLRELDALLKKRVAAYPDYVCLRAYAVQVSVALGDFEGALKELDAIVRDFPILERNTWNLLIRTELLRSLGRFDAAISHLEANAKAFARDPRYQSELEVLKSLRDGWRAEQEVRKEEAARDDLPRVRLRFDGKRDIVLELFEDDAPNAVANFIALVERGFYEGTRLHWVEGGRRAFGGDPNSRDKDPHNDGFGDPGYLIESEPGRRLNFHYTIAFADKRRRQRSEGSSFVIHVAPMPDLDGINSVFGRVIEGFEVVRGLEFGDRIEKTEVVRKRDHPYEPIVRKPK